MSDRVWAKRDRHRHPKTLGWKRGRNREQSRVGRDEEKEAQWGKEKETGEPNSPECPTS